MKAIIVEDESINAQELIRKIGTVAEDVEVIGVLPSVRAAKRWLMSNREPDFMFMDIQLSDGVSFEIFDEYQLGCPVVFTTAYDEYALRAFKVNSVDYLLKPINTAELKTAIDKCRRLVSREDKLPNDWADLLKTLSGKADNKPMYKEKFIVHQRQQWIPVLTADIAYFMRDNFYFLQTFSNEKYFLDFNSLEEVEDVLDPKTFFRANRQCIINIHAIQSIRLHDNGKLSLHLKAPLKTIIEVSREKAPSFKKWFEQ
ncbi:MAG TPA: LytTR family DNA-binding domain-containing protein [Chitinophagaceae bacterium]|jgi:DNA-binding LytR/AlgR family response regulator|nr:LytTR family DNA-binding domain-containing protein [Chitinophagaceae bacterium]